MKPSAFRTSRAILITAAACVTSVLAQDNLGTVYKNPAGGWTYSFQGTNAANGTGGFTALDGTWNHDDGSDAWDGSGLGGAFLSGTNTPGGISALSEGATTFIRIQDCGDGRDHGFPDPSNTTPPNPTNSNRKIYLGHNILTDDPLIDPFFLDNGVTLSFRGRVATTGLLDPQYPDNAGDGENRTLPGGTPWPATGSGYLIHDGGKGNFTIRQDSGDRQVSFSLTLASDVRNNLAPIGTTGLNMNSLNGAAPSGTVDSYQSEGTTTIMPLPSMADDFHEFWIVIQQDFSMVGTHKVDVYVDGSTVAESFIVTAGDGNDSQFNGVNFIGMGTGGTGQQGAIDVDFFAYKPGIHLPELREGGAPVGFSQQPQNAVVGENGFATFSLVATGGPPRILQWQRSAGGGAFTNIPGYLGLLPTLTVGPVPGGESGSRFRCIASNSLYSATSAVVTLTVDTDKIAPSVVACTGKHTLTNAIVSFSEPVTPASANVASYYTADKGLSIIGATLDRFGTNVVLHTSAQVPGTVYTITINNVRDASYSQNLITANTPAQFTSWVLTRGFLVSERFLGIPGNTVPELTTDPRYPALPDLQGYANSGAVPQSAPDLDTYGGRVIGWIVPPVTGDYTFYLRGDDDCELRLSSNADPAGLVQIIYAVGANNPYLPSGLITLNAGQRYAVEGLWKEGAGGDYIQVAWTTPNNNTPAFLPTCALESYTDPVGASITLTGPATPEPTLQFRTATLTANATYTPSNALTSFTWQRLTDSTWQTVACGPGASYTTPPLLYPADNGAQYRVIAAIPGTAATSAVTTLTVLADTVAPSVLSALRGGPCADTSIALAFNEALDAASATEARNYEIVNLTAGVSFGQNGASLTGTPVLSPDGQTAVLTASAPLTNGALYKVVISNVKDLAQNSLGSVSVLVSMRGGLLPTGAQNLVSVEAEDFDANTPRTYDAGAGANLYYWVFNNTRTGFSGSGVMQNLPNLEGNRPPGAEGASLDFCVRFPAPGLYYAWVRGGANGGADNSIHVGLDGVVPATGVNLQSGFDTAGYVWCGTINSGTTERAILDITAAGYHVVSIFMREDGFFADKLLLTTDSAYTPTGLGPESTLREQADVAPIAIVPGTLQNSGTTVSFLVQTVAGVNNVVEYKNALTDGSWTTLTSFAGNGALRSVSDQGPLPNERFYRARIAP